ncbi:glutamine synthetase, type I [Desulfurispirillum indicum S5]|uniref:Glutamine synthetase n=1 Tax=Desulfurispirillum indicum (strain ATCC BAA-1389 / DSM 22839 / S5) TaxID=653733 RepID=E6W4T4_DESIS|nr:type I glutamate--ammonia ligase [Desulfurispirillum indicum]ADU64812.1 glutamine synthetase, type I [Desulfurispirillum indicum S5]
MFRSIDEAAKYIRDNGVEAVDFRFTDLFGVWQHITISAGEVGEETLENGLGFDGSSIRGWCEIHNSDMSFVPDVTSAFVDPFFRRKTLVFCCDIVDPITTEKYNRDPRNIAGKAVNYLKQTGIADTAYFGPEAEFFIFDDVRFDSSPQGAFYFLDSKEGTWNTGADEMPNLQYKPQFKGGYFPVPPMDSLHELRSEMVEVMEKLGIVVEAHHHEVATAGQVEIDVRFTDMLKQADIMQLYKYVVRNVAVKNNKTVTFMPKPLYGDNGSGMHCHQSLWKDGKPLFSGSGYAGLSQEALWYLGGIIKHAKAIAAFTNPTTNSYKRLVPGFEAPNKLAYSSRNRSAAIRIPIVNSPKARRVEIRFPDPTANPYLAFSVMLMAGLDGIENKIDPGQPLDKNIYDLDPVELSTIPSMPGSLEESLAALEEDHEFLLKGDVFTPDIIEIWCDYKRNNEIKPLSLRPHPMEFSMYYSY